MLTKWVLLTQRDFCETSISIDMELWKEWTKFVIDKTGSARKLSEEIENAFNPTTKKSYTIMVGSHARDILFFRESQVNDMYHDLRKYLSVQLILMINAKVPLVNMGNFFPFKSL